MRFTKHEKRILILLVNNAELSDTSIANQLNISSQAVGQIRKKLEKEVIKKYTVELDLKKLGINLVVNGKVQINAKCDRSKLEIEKQMIKEPHNIKISKLTVGEDIYTFCSLFKNIHELNRFKIKANREECKFCSGCIKILEMTTLPMENMLKYNLSTIFKDCIDKAGIVDDDFNF